jgi:signal transduction histidine kinase
VQSGACRYVLASHSHSGEAMKFRTQLFGAIGALVAVSLFCGVMAAVTIHMTSQSADRITRRVVGDLEALHRVRLTAEQLVAAGRGYLLTAHPAEKARVAQIDAELDRALDALRARERAGLSSRIAQVEQTARDYARVLSTAVEQRGDGHPTALLENDVAPRRASLEAAVNALTDLEQEELTAVSRGAAHAERTVGFATLTASVSAIAIGLVLALITSKRLAGQFDREQAEKAAAKDAALSRKELLDVVSHDLRSPLGAIVLGLELLRAEHGDARYVNVIAHSAERMQRLVNDLLDASKAEVAQLEPEHEVRAGGDRGCGGRAVCGSREVCWRAAESGAFGRGADRGRSRAHSPDPGEPRRERDQVHEVRRRDRGQRDPCR